MKTKKIIPIFITIIVLFIGIGVVVFNNSGLFSKSISNDNTTSSITSSETTSSLSKSTESEYTNEVFPNLNLKYSSGWSFKQDNSNSKIDGLETIEGIFNNQNINVRIGTTPIYAGGSCIIPSDYTIETEVFKNGIFKNIVRFEDNTYLEYSNLPRPFCAVPGLIQSDLKAKDYPKYLDQIPDGEFVIYNFYIFANYSDDGQSIDASDTDAVTQIDNLLKGFEGVDSYQPLDSIIDDAAQDSSNSSSQFNGLAYTNEFFPSMKLNYTPDWKFSTSTSKSNYPELVSRSVVFTKDEAIVTVLTTPVFDTGCAGPSLANTESSKFDNGIYKHKTVYEDETYLSYYKSEFADCSLDSQIISNIDASISDSYGNRFEGGAGNVKFFLNIVVDYQSDNDTLRAINNLPKELENDIDLLIEGFEI